MCIRDSLSLSLRTACGGGNEPAETPAPETETPAAETPAEETPAATGEFTRCV